MAIWRPQPEFDDVIYTFVDDLEFEQLERLANLLDIAVEYPLDDMWPDWEAELRTEVCEELGEYLKPTKKRSKQKP